MVQERGRTQETIGQQFTDYVIAHSEPVVQDKYTDAEIVRVSYWQTNIPLPLMRDFIKEISFEVRELTLSSNVAVRGSAEDYESETKPTYDIGIYLSSGSYGYYTYRPNNTKVPYEYSSPIDSGSEPFEEAEAAKLIAELKEYEAAGLMTKIVPEAS